MHFIIEVLDRGYQGSVKTLELLIAGDNIEYDYDEKRLQMKVGDLIRHRESGDYGIIVKCESNIPGIPGGMVAVKWMELPETARNDWVYRATVLEVIDVPR